MEANFIADLDPVLSNTEDHGKDGHNKRLAETHQADYHYETGS